VRYCDPVAALPIGRLREQRGLHMLAEDLSEDGLRLSSPEMIAVETRLLLDIEPERWGLPIRAVGKVIWVAETNSPDRWYVGVAFVELSDNARERLAALVASRKAAKKGHKGVRALLKKGL
jgi:hypothetical protein